MSADTIESLERRMEDLRAQKERALDAAADLLDQLNATKQEIALGASAGRNRGRYVEPGRWDTLQKRMGKLPGLHQAALREVSRIKKEITEVGNAINAQQQERNRNGERSFAESFLDVAREMLDVDVFATLMREASLRKNRDLVRYQHTPGVGAALPVRAAVGGMKRRVGE